MGEKEAVSESSRGGGGGWLRYIACRILKAGHIPKHVAIIMDGNRRFARKMQYSKVFQGHVLGFDKFIETLEWCLDLGITEMTVYVFSIENFKRPKEEVDGLMELAKQKVTKLLDKKELIMKHGVCIRVLGNLELLPGDVLEAVARAVGFTRNNDRAFLNVCFSYTSRHEMAEAVRRMAQGTVDETILPSDVSEELFERCLYSGDSPPPDLIIRTSGEVRLSDFLLWQSSYSCLSFQNVLWPEFSIWNFFSAIVTYQRSYATIQEAKKKCLERRRIIQYNSDKRVVSQNECLEGEDLEKKIFDYASRREARLELFVNSVRKQHMLYLERACPHF